MTKEDIFDLISDAGYGTLATVDGGHPRIRPMMPYLDEDNGELLLAVLSQSRTIGQIKANPKIEMCYVDRKMNFARVRGDAAVSDDAGKKEQVWNTIPMLRQYFTSTNDPNFVLLVIKINSIEAMTPQQKEPDVVEL